MLTERPMAVLKKHGINADIRPVDILPAGELKDGTLHIGKGAIIHWLFRIWKPFPKN